MRQQLRMKKSICLFQTRKWSGWNLRSAGRRALGSSFLGEMGDQGNHKAKKNQEHDNQENFPQKREHLVSHQMLGRSASCTVDADIEVIDIRVKTSIGAVAPLFAPKISQPGSPRLFTIVLRWTSELYSSGEWIHRTATTCSIGCMKQRHGICARFFHRR